MAYKGKFSPKNKQKYIGDVTNIVYRSLLERRFMVWLDLNPSVMKWCSEEIVIPYWSPVDNKNHRYFPDFLFEQIKTVDGKEISTKYLVEVKPKSQTSSPKPPEVKDKRKQRRYLKESVTWVTNSCKWAAAEEWCKNNNSKFIIITEKDIDNLSPKIKK
jgi:hypothetical protein